MNNLDPQSGTSARRQRVQPTRVGEVRSSQALYPYGVGSVVDLPQLSVLVTGLDDWPQIDSPELKVNEPRLLKAVQSEVPTVVELRRIPLDAQSDLGLNNPLNAGRHVGVPVRTFPRWLVCPACRTLARIDSGLFKFEDGRGRPDRARYVHENCQQTRKPPTALPARFMVACEDGHLDDFPWIWYVHRGQPCSGSAVLRLIEFGPGGEARDLLVKCEGCGLERRMAEAFNRENMPACTGRRPHLRDFDPNGCQCDNCDHVRTILLGASNLWFPVIYGAIALPETADPLEQLVREQWAKVRDVQQPGDLEFLQRRGELQVFAEYDLTAILNCVRRVAQSAAQTPSAESDDQASDEMHESLKAPEWKAFSNPHAVPFNDDFRLRQVGVPTRFKDYITKVVLVERMREVRALAGFTRIDAPGELADLDIEIVGSQLAPLSKGPTRWVPAAELRGEGIFIQFDEHQMQSWLSKPECDAWDHEIMSAHRLWRHAHYLTDVDRGYPGLRYVLLHTFSHTLMRQFALDCGYSQASLQERIYASEPDQASGPMAGVLIYTSATDSEGTLGGLVRLGETDELDRHLRMALQSETLCSSDPTCSEHLPTQSALSVHGAACHSCLFAPETSCERGNKYLDRSVLVETLVNADRAFFGL